MIRTVFFDFDGTLFATEADIVESYRKTFALLGMPSVPVRIGPPMAEALRQIMPAISEAELKRVGDTFVYTYDHSGYPNTYAYEGIPEMLAALAERGIEAVIATNKRVIPTETILRQHGLRERIRGVYSPDGVPGEKVDKAEAVAARCAISAAPAPNASWSATPNSTSAPGVRRASARSASRGGTAGAASPRCRAPIS